ncbi:MAG: hypothetical protein V4819_01005 [Verrucomicrobiota bacterium]
MAAKKIPKQAELIDSPSGFLGSTEEHQPPAEFDRACRRLVLDVPEFRLVEYWRPRPYGRVEIEWAPAIRSAYFKALGRFQKDSGINSTEDKANLLDAFLGLHYFTKLDTLNPGNWEGSFSTSKLVRSLGRKLLEIESAESEREAEARRDEVISLCSTVLRGFTVWARGQSDGRTEKKPNEKKPNEISVFRAAEFLIEAARCRPDKSTIRELVEATGEKFTGNNVKADWNRIFTSIGFERFPDFPAFV